MNFCIVDPAKSSHANVGSGVLKGRVQNIFFLLFRFIASADYFLYGVVTNGQGDSLLIFNKNEYVRNHHLETIEETSRNTNIKIF